MPRYSSTLIEVCLQMLQLYSATLGRSPTIDHLFLKLRDALRREIGVQRDMQRTVGALELLLSTADAVALPEAPAPPAPKVLLDSEEAPSSSGPADSAMDEGGAAGAGMSRRPRRAASSDASNDDGGDRKRRRKHSASRQR